MTSEEIFKVWYRSVTEDGKVWCESSDPDEVRQMSKGKKVTYHKLTQKLVTGNWEQMSKKQLKKAHYRVPSRSIYDFSDPVQARTFDNLVQRMNHLSINDGFMWHMLSDEQIRKRLEELDD